MNLFEYLYSPAGNICRQLNIYEEVNKIKNWYGDTINYINNLAAGKILDIGSGLGYFLSGVNENWIKYAQDYSSYALDFVKENQPKVNLCNDDVYHLRYDDNTFDAVMFYHVIEHLDNPLDALKELNRILKHGGTLMIGTPNIKSIAGRLFKGRFRQYGPPHINLFTPQNLRQILENNGFEIFRKEYPFFRTDYATITNFIKILLPIGISPAFDGSVMTYYCKKIN
jgi:ubiquinone/menaquinone biosynthesis C-methylase UbiE